MRACDQIAAHALSIASLEVTFAIALALALAKALAAPLRFV
jgi:hypothetical protein